MAWEIIKELTAWRDDVFFYVLYPPHKMDAHEWEFLQRYSDKVTLIPMEQGTSDRVSESFMLRNNLRFMLNPWNEKTWDADVVISSRMPVVKHMRVHSSRSMGGQMESHRAYIGLEEMPFLPFRDTVPWGDSLYPDTLMSYALNDLTLVSGQWLKSSLKPVLKEVLSPAYQKRVLDRVVEALPVKLQRLNLKTDLYKEGDFNLTFVGRITGTRNFGDAAEMMRKQFSYPLGKGKQDMKFLVSTNSSAAGAGKYGEIDFIDMQMNDREQFYQFLKKAHLALNLSTVEDFSLTTYETLLNGIPIIVHDHPWNSFLGKDYPFRAKTELETYALVNAFASDYEGQYAKFRAWEETHWKQYVEGPMNLTTSEALVSFLNAFEKKREEHMQNKGKSYAEALKTAPVLGGKLDLTQYLKDSGTCVIKDSVEEHFSLPLGRVPSTLMIKLVAQQQGWKDTNKTGVMTK